MVPRTKRDRVRSFSAGARSGGRSDFRATPIPVLPISEIPGAYYCVGFRSSSCIVTGGSADFNALLGGSRVSGDQPYARLEAHGLYWTTSESGATTMAL